MQTNTKLTVESFLFRQVTSRFIKAGLSLCLVFFSHAFAQLDSGQAEIKRAQVELDNGNYLKAVELTNEGIEKAWKIDNSLLVSEALDIKASSEIFLAEHSLKKYEEAAKTLDEALQILPENKANANKKGLIYIHYAWLYRSQRKFSESLNYSKKALAAAPENRYILAAHYLNTGRILFTSGYDVSAIVWLEKAEKLLESESVSRVKIDTYRFYRSRGGQN